MKKQIRLLGIASTTMLILCSSCATTGKSIGAGAGAGAALGAGVGALADPGEGGEHRIRNVLIGTAIGGVVGAGTGYVADRYAKDEKDAAYQKGKLETQKEISEHPVYSDANQPKLVPPRTEARWIPDQVRGATFVPGHFEYIILEGAKWEPTR